ncbi:unnamed protein product [Amoebophrya sp. A25]|nr:unnamed protein product [Amoebophrya sp. A25]|eukprot:GSA25T00023847001.1
MVAADTNTTTPTTAVVGGAETNSPRPAKVRKIDPASDDSTASTKEQDKQSFVPVLDLAPMFLPADAEGREESVQMLARELKRTMEEVGFFQIKGHHFPAQHLQEFLILAHAFFDLPDAEKRKFPMTPSYPYGYEAAEILAAGFENERKTEVVEKDGQGAQGEAPSKNKKTPEPDMKETFNFTLHPKFPPKFPIDTVFLEQLDHDENDEKRKKALELFNKHQDALGENAVEKNKIFSHACTRYYESMFSLAKVLLRLFARALELPSEDWFLEKVNQHQSAVRALNYPHQDSYQVGRMRASEHSDYGILTILKQDTTGGLQVRRELGVDKHDWVDVGSSDDCFVVNIGDLMQRWTNDKWKSTVHRVVSPKLFAEQKSNRRQSVAFFFNANEDAVIETFASCVGEENKYPPVIAGEYLLGKHGKANQETTTAPDGESKKYRNELELSTDSTNLGRIM